MTAVYCCSCREYELPPCTDAAGEPFWEPGMPCARCGHAEHLHMGFGGAPVGRSARNADRHGDGAAELVPGHAWGTDGYQYPLALRDFGEGPPCDVCGCTAGRSDIGGFACIECRHEPGLHTGFWEGRAPVPPPLSSFGSDRPTAAPPGREPLPGPPPTKHTRSGWSL